MPVYTSREVLARAPNCARRATARAHHLAMKTPHMAGTGTTTEARNHAVTNSPSLPGPDDGTCSPKNRKTHAAAPPQPRPSHGIEQTAMAVPDARPSLCGDQDTVAALLHSYTTQWEARRLEFQSFRAMVDGAALCELVIRDLTTVGRQLNGNYTTLTSELTAYSTSHVGPQHRSDAPLRERFWEMQGEIRLTAKELAAALGKPASWVYRHTSPRSGLRSLPFRKETGGALVFVVDEIRQWIAAYERVPSPLEEALPRDQERLTNRSTRETSR